MKKPACAVMAMVFMLMTISGCTTFSSIDELYSLPQPQEEYLQLQEVIDEEIAAGSEYSAPTVGSQRQSIQLVDIDGDGNEEALAFLHDEDLTPKICIYQNVNGEYSLVCTITGEGSAIGRVEYADLNNDGRMEIIVSWTMSSDLMLADAYSVNDWSTSVMLSENCTDFLIGDINSDDSPDVVVLNFDDDGGTVSVSSADIAGEVTKISANISSLLDSASRFRISTISGGIPAVFVEGSYDTEEGGTMYLTDIFVAKDGKLKNITLGSGSADSVAIREYDVFAYDIDGDGALEVPFVEEVAEQPKVTAQYYVFDWYSFDEDGNYTLSLSTYHCYGDSWYLVLPDRWRSGFSVRRETGHSGERTVVLSTVNAYTGDVTDLITIYTLTDENRADRAQLEGRFVLLSNETTIYAAKFDNIDADKVTEEQQEDIVSRFHLIYTEWNIGAV